MAAMRVGGAERGGEEGGVWYFAYGSNMHPGKRVERAQVRDLEVHAASVRGWRLAFDMHGVPPAEPSMANLRAEADGVVHGLLIRMRPDDFAALVESEGGDRFYVVEEVEARPYAGAAIRARTFVARPERRRSAERPPSLRYMTLLREGARAGGLDPAYCEYLDGLPVSEAAALGKACSALVLEAFAAASRSRFRALASGYLALLQRTEELAPIPRAAAQGVVLAPALATALGLRAVRAIGGVRRGGSTRPARSR